MKEKKAFLILEAALCAALAVLLAAAVIGIYREGAARREAGETLAWIFTREKLAQRMAPILPLGGCALGLALLGRALGIRDERDGTCPARMTKAPAERPRRTAAVRAAVLAAALTLIAAGILNGGMRDVLVKAINLCAECVGLG